MKSIICSVLIGLFLVTACKYFRTNAEVFIDSITRNELNKRLHVQGTMGGNITLISNSSIGSGGFAFVLSGKTGDGTPVAIKATTTEDLDDLQSYIQEYHCYERLNATTDKMCEKYGIPFIYHSGDFLHFKTMAMTKLDFTLEKLQRKIGLLSKDTILIMFRDMIKTLKFMHVKGITNQDIKSNNIMTKGANVFLFDFNVCVDKHLPFLPTITMVDDKDTAEYNDMINLHDTMTDLANSTMYCSWLNRIDSDKEIGEQKRQMKEQFVLKNKKYTELAEPFVEFCFEATEAKIEKRLPNYDYLYKMFDDTLYSGRNRSERIVFEWLTPAERAAAMAESVSSIESIISPDENSH